MSNQSRPVTVQDGTLTAEQRENFLKYINSKTALVGKCPICSDRKWALLDHLVHMPVFYGPNTMVVGGASYPHVGMICTNCGNTQLVNAVVAGIMPGHPVDKPENDGSPESSK